MNFFLNYRRRPGEGSERGVRNCGKGGFNPAMPGAASSPIRFERFNEFRWVLQNKRRYSAVFFLPCPKIPPFRCRVLNMQFSSTDLHVILFPSQRSGKREGKQLLLLDDD